MIFNINSQGKPYSLCWTRTTETPSTLNVVIQSNSLPVALLIWLTEMTTRTLEY